MKCNRLRFILDPAQFKLVSTQPGVAWLDAHTGEITVTSPVDSQGHATPVEVIYQMNDGAADGNLANARFGFPGDAGGAIDSPDRYALTQGGSINFPMPTTGAIHPINPQFGTLVVKGDGTYDYRPAASFSGQDWFTYTVDGTTGDSGTTPGYPLYHTVFFNVAAAQPKITAHRTGLNVGAPVSVDVKRHGAASDYLLMVNNGHDENHADGSADNTDTTATPDEKNLAKLELTGVNAGHGVMTLALTGADAGEVRLLGQDASASSNLTEICAPDQTSLSVDLAHPTGPLAGLAHGGTVTVWVEGIKPTTLTVSLNYYGQDSSLVATDSVKMTVAEL